MTIANANSFVCIIISFVHFKLIVVNEVINQLIN